MLPDDQRQNLKRFILRVAHNRDPECEPARAEYLIRRAVGTILPIALEAGRLVEYAAQLGRVATTGAIEELQDATVDVGVVAANGGCAVAANAAAFAVNAAAADTPLRAGGMVAKVAEAAGESGGAELRQRVYDAAIETLEGVLGIGRQADAFDETEVRRAIAVFDVARGDLTGLPDAA